VGLISVPAGRFVVAAATLSQSRASWGRPMSRFNQHLYTAYTLTKPPQNFREKLKMKGFFIIK